MKPSVLPSVESFMSTGSTVLTGNTDASTKTKTNHKKDGKKEIPLKFVLLLLLMLSILMLFVGIMIGYMTGKSGNKHKGANGNDAMYMGPFGEHTEASCIFTGNFLNGTLILKYDDEESILTSTFEGGHLVKKSPRDYFLFVLKHSFISRCFSQSANRGLLSDILNFFPADGTQGPLPTIGRIGKVRDDGLFELLSNPVKVNKGTNLMGRAIAFIESRPEYTKVLHFRCMTACVIGQKMHE